MRSKRTYRNDDESDNDTNDTAADCVKTVNNTIYYYGDINDDNVFELITQLKELEIKLLKLSIDYPDFKPKITLHIKSDGGDIFAGFSAADHIKTCRVPVWTVANGCCASAATFLLLAGKKRFMGPSGFVLIHQLSSGMWGKYQEMKEEIESCDKFMDSIKGMYKDKTTIPDKKLKAMMKKDIYLTSSECIKYSIVDDIHR